MSSFILWYLAIVLIGWLAFPLAYRLLRFLPDRGLNFSKPLGLLVYGFLFWLLASLHAIQNDIGGVLIALAILAALGWWFGHGHWAEMRSFLTGRRNAAFLSEMLFFLAFAFWALVRSFNPDAAGTEKPMELAFINAILRSPVFPPHDPWLSGYSISYYYFGYVLVAMLARLTASLGSVAFNLGLASWFGLVSTAGYGLLYNLLEVRNSGGRRFNEIAALLAPLFILLVSNLGGPLEVMHASGAFWQVDLSKGANQSSTAFFPPAPKCQTQENAQMTSPFWSWLDLQELNCPPTPPFDGQPKRAGGIWWWRSSRVLTDYDLNNGPREVIDEFPAFSYLLGDLHPHVLSMPFVLLATGLALNLYLAALTGAMKRVSWKDWLRQAEFWLAAVVLGGLAFLNTWDFPIYVALYCSAYVLARAQGDGWRWERLRELLVLGLELGAAGILLYFPFYIGFASQAGGLLPSLSFFTRGIHFWIMFATLLTPILLWLGVSTWKIRRPKALQWAIGLSAAAVFGLWALSYLYGMVMLASPEKGSLLVSIQGGVAAGDLLVQSLARRISYPGMWISMFVLLGLVFWQLLSLAPGESSASPESEETAAEADGAVAVEASEETGTPGPVSRTFVLLLVLVGCGLGLVPEFFYLRDQFGWRMNTIFKFYFQAWILWSVAAAFAVVSLSRWLRGGWVWVVRALCLGAIALGLVYPYFLIPDRTQGFKTQNWTLDGGNYIRLYQPDDYNAIQFLRTAPEGVVAEAIGGSYDATYARVATHSGQPTVLGWPGHESQWRGGAKEIGSREADIESLYNASDWNQASAIIQRYNIRYIFVGSAEMGKYRVNTDKFNGHLSVVYSSGSTKVYAVP